jgi:hypothetical protein
MFSRRQAIRWAELWLSCWNDRDLDTLLALYGDQTAFGRAADNASIGDRKEALRRHWAAVPFGIHAGHAELEQVIWDRDSRELAIVYAAQFDGARLRGCDLVTLDDDDHIVDGEPCVGSLVDVSQANASAAGVTSTAGGR